MILGRCDGQAASKAWMVNNCSGSPLTVPSYSCPVPYFSSSAKQYCLSMWAGGQHICFNLRDWADRKPISVIEFSQKVSSKHISVRLGTEHLAPDVFGCSELIDVMLGEADNKQAHTLV